MEDIRDSSNKKSQLYLEVSRPEKFSFLTKKKLESRLHIREFDSYYEINYKDRSSKIPLNCPQTWTQRFFKSMLQQKASTGKAPFSQKSLNILTKKSVELNLLRILNSNMNESEDFISFVQSLLKTKEFKAYKKLHLFVHQKSQTFCQHYECSINSKQVSKLDISDFTSFFNSIKKSKDRSYGEISLKGYPFNIIGTFLAHEFSLKHHSIIIVLSREDFLPQTEEEKSFFKTLVTILPAYLEQQLFKLEHEVRLKNYITLFRNIDFKFEILAKERTLFSNCGEFVYRPQSFSPESQYETRFYSQKSSKLNHTEIFHNERITLLGELLNTLKHELSNPLFGLQLSSEILLLESLEPEHEEFIQQINNSIKRCQDIINDFNNIYSSKEEDNVDLLEIIDEVFTLTKSENKQFKKNIYNESSLESIILTTNPTSLAQVLFNLILNSSQACKELKNPQIDIRITSLEEFIQITVSDNGPGIPIDIQKQVFTPFYTTKEKGTGLGLAISKQLIEKLRGTLVYNNTDKGASFTITLPYENLNS